MIVGIFIPDSKHWVAVYKEPHNAGRIVCFLIAGIEVFLGFVILLSAGLGAAIDEKYGLQPHLKGWRRIPLLFWAILLIPLPIYAGWKVVHPVTGSTHDRWVRKTWAMTCEKYHESKGGVMIDNRIIWITGSNGKEIGLTANERLSEDGGSGFTVSMHEYEDGGWKWTGKNQRIKEAVVIQSLSSWLDSG